MKVSLRRSILPRRHEKGTGSGFWVILMVMDIERTMEFIVEQQAQLTASAQKRDEQIAKHDEQIAKQGEQIAALTDLVGRLAQAEIRLVDRMEKLESGQQEMRAAMTQLFQRMDRFIQGLEGDGHKRG